MGTNTKVYNVNLTKRYIIFFESPNNYMSFEFPFKELPFLTLKATGPKIPKPAKIQVLFYCPLI